MSASARATGLMGNRQDQCDGGDQEQGQQAGRKGGRAPVAKRQRSRQHRTAPRPTSQRLAVNHGG